MAPGDRHCIVPPVRLKVACHLCSAILSLLKKTTTLYEHQHNQAELSQTLRLSVRRPRKSTR